MLWNSILEGGGLSHKDLLPTEVQGSFDHVLWGFQNHRVVVDWFEHRASPGRAEYDDSCSIERRCADRFGREPLVVDLSCSPIISDWTVRRVLLTGAMRKEWNHNRRFSPVSRPRDARVEVAINAAPHPYG
ncbi:MAG: hypothetical protein RLZZ450_533 [Pseudomonadota bacterium]